MRDCSFRPATEECRIPRPSVLQTASKLALSRQSHASPAPTLRKFKIRLLYAIAALALRLSALRLVRRPPPARLTRHLAMAKRDASAFDEAAATRDAKKLKVAELRAALEAAGADTKGLKAELVERLVAAGHRRIAFVGGK